MSTHLSRHCSPQASFDVVVQEDEAESARNHRLHSLRGVSRDETEEAVRTLIRWAGDDPARSGLKDTPARVVRAYEEWFSGYREEPKSLLERTFDETGSYDGAVELHAIPFVSFCEHHLAAIRGIAHIAYLPVERVVGISKLVRLVESCAKRLQIQERLTAEIATFIEIVLKPQGVAVVIEAEHGCMTTRGVRCHGTVMVTSSYRGAYRDDSEMRAEFMQSVGRH